MAIFRRTLTGMMIALALVVVGTPSQAQTRQWVDVFQSSPAAYGVNTSEQPVKDAVSRLTTVTGTVRFQMSLSAGGQDIRVRFSNETGTQPLKLSAASIALTTGFDGVADTVVPLTFGGHKSTTIPAGAPMISDAVALPVKASDQLLVSVSVPEGIAFDPLGATGMWVAPGDQTRQLAMTSGALVIGRPIVSGVSVLADRPMPVIVTLGDSITAGGRKVPEPPHGWPEVLSQRLNGEIAVVNAGIAGNRILSDGYGPGALTRLDRDVLRLEAAYVIVLEGINDIGFPGRVQFGVTQPDIQLEDLIAGYRQIITRVHARGGKVIGATLLPFAGAFYYTSAKDEMRQQVNAWIRTSGEFDAVVDFDAVMRDPVNPLSLRTEFDSGDHLHPNPHGLKAMAEFIDLNQFR